MPRGKKKYIETPQKLYDLFLKYVDDTKSSPKHENVLVHKTGEIHLVPKERPLTWWGFENWLNRKGVICNLSSYEHNENKSYDEYLPIITRIKREIYEDKYDGATAGLYQHNIIARDLGLVDKKQVSANVKSEISDLTDEQLQERLNKLKNFPDKEDE